MKKSILAIIMGILTTTILFTPFLMPTEFIYVNYKANEMKLWFSVYGSIFVILCAITLSFVFALIYTEILDNLRD